MVIAAVERLPIGQRLAQLAEMADAHLSVDQIAERTGLSRATVKVYLWRVGRLRPPLTLNVDETVQARWRKEAGARGVDAQKLMARALELIAADNLFTAVFDA